jgi:hypothetical protein
VHHSLSLFVQNRSKRFSSGIPARKETQVMKNLPITLATLLVLAAPLSAAQSAPQQAHPKRPLQVHEHTTNSAKWIIEAPPLAAPCQP